MPPREESQFANVLLAMIPCIAALALMIAPPQSAASSARSAPAKPALSGGTIFAKARLAMYLRSYPRYVAYIIDIQSTAYGKHYHEGYRAMLRTHDNALVVKQTPIYTTNQPPNPYGFSFFGLNREGKPQDHIEPPFGVPLMSATFDFDLALPPAPKPGSETPAPLETQPPVIGHVAVTGGDYDVTLLGEEDDDGFPVYHLSLQPLHDPDRNRLRELWVDEKTFDVRKLVTSGIFPGGPPAQVPWTVKFIQLQGHWFIRTESTAATLRSPGHLFGGATEYQGITYTFGAYEYPGLILDIEFTPLGLNTDAVQE